MKFDVVVPISRTPDEAISLWQISTIVTVLILALLLLVGRSSPSWLENIDISPTGGTWPLVLVASGVVAAFQYSNAWLLYAHSYVAISLIKLARELCFVGFALLFFNTWLGNRGLLFGFLIATLVGAIISFVMALARGLRPFLGRIWQVFSRYSDFPLKAAVPAMLDLVALTAPLLAINRLYSLGDTAMFGLFRQTITASLSLVSAAFGQVLTRQLAELIASKQHVYRLVLNTFIVLSGISSAIAVAVLFEGSQIFRIIYGANWPQAGSIAIILVVPAVCQFVASALSGALIALRRLTWLACWQILHFFFIALLIYPEPQSIKQFLFGLAAIDVVLSLPYLLIIARAVLSYERAECEAFARTI
jgi:O-antigen/teichoic acid export membrane protein